MATLTLYAPTEQDLGDLIADPAAFERRRGWRIADGALPPASVFETALRNMRSAPQWNALACMRLYLLDGVVVGSGGAKGAPDEGGEIEIGYGVAPEFGGRGIGRAAALRIVEDAFARGVASIVASTRPDNERSWRLLASLGFERAGDVIDDEDGLVWCWRLVPAGLRAARDETAGAAT